MAFDPLSWAIGFALTRGAERLLRRSEAKELAKGLRDAASRWAKGLPQEAAGPAPDAILHRLFEADCEAVGPRRQRLANCFEAETVPEEDVWLEALCERREEIRTEYADEAQTFFLLDLETARPHLMKLAGALHKVCGKNEGFFKATVLSELRGIKDLVRSEREARRAPPQRTPPADGLGVLHGVPAPLERFVPRPEYAGPLQEKLLAGKGKAVAVTAAGKRKVGVQGMGGIGKTVLAAAAVREEEVRRAFPDGVFWLTFGQQPNLIARQVQLARWLGDERPAFEDTQQGRARLEELLRDATCLVVLDDIWDTRDVQPFDVVGEGTRLLVTTRFRNVVAGIGAVEHRLDVLPKEQAMALLAKWAGTGVEELPSEAGDVVKQCAGLPLALAMIGAMIQRRPERWENALHRLRTADLDRIKQEFPDYPYPDLLRAIEVSIDGLDDIKERYLDFAIFPEDTPVPQAVLETLWGSDGLDEYAAQDVLDTLEDRSMLQRDQAGCITLHDLQLDYVRNRVGEKLPARHRKLLKAYQARCPDGWHSGPDDGYFFQHLPQHLRAARKKAELAKLMFDYRWLRSALRATDSNALIADYDLLADNAQARLLQGAIRLSSHVLAEEPSHLPSQLSGRLLSQKGARTKALLKGLSGHEEGAWLRPLATTLTPPGGPLLRTLRGHKGFVNAVAVTGDGRYAVSGSHDRTLKVWDLRSGAPVHTLAGHEDYVNAVAVTSDGRRAVSGSSDRTLKVWDLQSGALVYTLWGHEESVLAVAVTGDGRYALSGSSDRTLKVWDLQSGSVVHTLARHEGDVNVVAVTGDGRYAISGSSDWALKVCDLQSGAVVHTLAGHEAPVNVVAATGDGRYAVSASLDETLKVWDLQSGSVVHTLAGHEDYVNAVAVTGDGRYAVSGSSDETLKVWDLRRGSLVHTLAGHEGDVNAVAVTGDGRRAVSASSDQTLKVWDLRSGSAVHMLSGHADYVNALAVTGDGRYAVSASSDRTLKVWDLRSGALVYTLSGHEDWVNAVAVTGDGRYAVSASDDRTLKVWDLQSGALVHTLSGHEGDVTAVAVTGDGRYAVSGSYDQTLKVWDLQSGAMVHTLVGHEDWVKALAVTGDGRYAVSGSDDRTLKVWDLQSGAVVHTLASHEGYLNAVAVTSDGRCAVSGSDDRTLKMWDLASGALVHTLAGHEGDVTAVVVTGDGRYAVSGSYDQTLGVWDLPSGAMVHTLVGHEDWVKALAVTGDGRYAVSGSDDRMLKVWNLQSGRVVASFCGDAGILCCALAPDGRTIVAGDRSGRVHLLRLENVD